MTSAVQREQVRVLHITQSVLRPAVYSKVMGVNLSPQVLALLTMKLPEENSGVMQIFLYPDRSVQNNSTQLLLRMFDLF